MNIESSAPRQNVHFSSNGREVAGYLASPAGGSGPGVIVIQEWWGLDDHLVSICDRLAEQGFVALAPDLYGGRVAHGTDDAGALMKELPVEQAARDLGGSVDYLLGQEQVTSKQVGAIGFCMGGGFVLLLGAQQGEKIAAVVSFYGVGPSVPDSYATMTADVQGHYGEQDSSYPVERAHQREEQLRKESHGSVEFFYYPAGHAFNNDTDRMGTYDPQAAAQAWTRTVDFLRARLG